MYSLPEPRASIPQQDTQQYSNNEYLFENCVRRARPLVLKIPHCCLQVLTVIFKLVYAQFGVRSSSRWFLVDEDLQTFTVADDLVDSRLYLIFHKVNIIS